jgi:hypothetical protein
MEILKDWYKRCFGKMEGLELIAARLRNGAPYVKAYDGQDNGLVYFKGTGEHVSGWGQEKRYDVHFQVLNHVKGYGEILTDWHPVHKSMYLRANLEDLKDSYLIGLQDQEGENDPEEVIAWLRKIASRLKPHQAYTLNMMTITHELFSGDRIRMFGGGREVLIPREYMGNRRLVTEAELGTTFNGNKVRVANEEKIKREHRLNTDPKRWFVLTKVDSVTDKHAIRFTHRKTANAPVFYYALEIIADSKAMVGHPFYVKELLCSAVDSLSKDHSSGDYQLEITTSAIDFTWDNKTVSIDVYRDNQSKYPASVDKQPVLIYPELMVVGYVYYGSGDAGWNIRERAEVEAERAALEKGSNGRKKS